MARTYRRREKHLVAKYVGERGVLLQYLHWDPMLSTHYPRKRFWSFLECDENEDPVKKYDQRLAMFYRDGGRKLYTSAPRWFRHQRFNDPMRRAEQDEIRRCMRLDCWDDHLTGTHPSGAGWLWGWIN